MKEDRWRPQSPLITRGVSGTGRLAWHHPYQERFDGYALLTHPSTCLPSLISILKLCQLNWVRSLLLSSCHYHQKDTVRCLLNWCPQTSTWEPGLLEMRVGHAKSHHSNSEIRRQLCSTDAQTENPDTGHEREAGDARHFSSAFQFCSTALPSALKMFLE